ncbi:chemotaxis protein CheD [Desulfonema magnum]|uniref:Probable chemoreceptor glutamine deamidase CheD n=1 Tax=Desulfonema magnum TaxID=45655 RepID=A0A975GLX5_9BACT|nr:chemotaxis protein CheD [Desulfonema magnum]QTA85258.1 Putative chemoreceptor glutamine deamidase, CheD-like [Desulfonema magnum]
MMSTESDKPVTVNYFLEPGYIFLATKPAIISGVLGSCVSVCLYDRKRKIGGMNHFQLPYAREKGLATAIYGNAAIVMLIRMMTSDGSKIKHLEAQILGGAYNPGISQKNIGQENIKVARRILAEKRISVVSEDVGGEKGRKIVFNTNTNEVAVIKVDRLRKGDWYPYESDR